VIARCLTCFTTLLVVLLLLPLSSRPAASPAAEIWRDAGVARVVAAKPVPRLQLTGIDGRPVETFRERDRLTILYFWATW
jgi:hypothetical protein